MIQGLLEKVFGTQNTRTIAKLQPMVDQINSLEPELEKLSDQDLRAKTDIFRGQLNEGRTLDDILPEAFAVVREAAKRTLKMRHYDVQMLGGIVLHQGSIAEMSTGEGKTLVATLPVYLNAIEGKGVHVITVNDYLAKRDCEWMGPVYEFLGLSVGVIQHDMPVDDRRAAYAADITFGTNNEYGFDYLRDNMVPSLELRVQRKLNFAIIDEVDSILIDEARTPLIISGPAEESTDKYYKIDKIIPKLNAETDYKIDEKANNVSLTEDGVRHCESLLGVDNLYENTQIDLIHHVNQALKAHTLFKLDDEYMIKDGEVVIVDEFTGRLMPGRRFSDGLHQALEAKEGVKIERENQTLATVTFQNYFRMYEKLSGMTGTASTEAVEFQKIYKLGVVVIPTNKPCVRDDQSDGIYRTENEKYEAVIQEILKQHKAGRPALVGTISIEKSERVSNMLKKHNLPHVVLNAKFHEREAEIVANAGQPGAITIATNMAGRGTDIVLGEGVKEKGGLALIGTERHESRRIDNQLRGRCGRQGDPGSSKFFISLDDDLMRIFGADRMDKMQVLMAKMGMEEGEEIQHPLVTKAIETAQGRVETRNFEIRKHLLEFDDVMNRQREIIYAERDRVLKGDKLREHIFEMIEDVVEDVILTYMSPDMREEDKNPKGLIEALNLKFGGGFDTIVNENQENNEDVDLLIEDTLKKVKENYDMRVREFTPERMVYLEKSVLLQMIDSKWKDHLHSLDQLKEGIGLRAYGQRDPLTEYKREGFSLFDMIIDSIKLETVEILFRIQAVKEEQMTSVLSPTENTKLLHPEAQGIPQAPVPQQAMPQNIEGLPGRQPPVRQEKPQSVKRDVPKVGRNDPCSCGSGKKYKKCCGINE